MLISSYPSTKKYKEKKKIFTCHLPKFIPPHEPALRSCCIIFFASVCLSVGDAETAVYSVKPTQIFYWFGIHEYGRRCAGRQNWTFSMAGGGGEAFGIINDTNIFRRKESSTHYFVRPSVRLFRYAS